MRGRSKRVFEVPRLVVHWRAHGDEERVSGWLLYTVFDNCGEDIFLNKERNRKPPDLEGKKQKSQSLEERGGRNMKETTVESRVVVKVKSNEREIKTRF